MQVDSIRNFIHSKALLRNGDRSPDIKAMLGDPTKAGVYMNMVSGGGIPLEKISHAVNNRLSADDVLSLKALIGLARYGLRFTEQAVVDDSFRGLVGSSERIPDRLKVEVDHKRQVYRAREQAWLEKMDETAKKDPFTQQWLSRLRLNLNDLVIPVLNPGAIDRAMGLPMPPTVLERTRRIGFFQTDIPEKHGGFGFDNRRKDFVLQFIPELGGLAAPISAHESIGVAPLHYGTSEQQDYFIPPMVHGDEEGKHYIVAFGLTERNSGTNAIKQMQTEARLSEDGEHLILNGSKVYTTNLYFAGLVHLAVNIIDPVTGTKLPTVIELKLPFRLSDTEEERREKIDELWKQGIQITYHPQQLSGFVGSAQGSWELHNVKVPLKYPSGHSSILGDLDGIGRGSEIIFGGLNKGRCGFLTTCTYSADFIINKTLENIVAKVRYPGEYSNAGVIGDLELVQSRIAEMVVKTEAMKAVSELTSALVDTYPDMNIIAEAALGKAFTSELAIDVIQTAQSLWGGEGYMRGEVIEQALRDITTTRTVEGINDVMFQAGAAASAGPLQTKSVFKILWDLIPSLERGDLGRKDAFGLQLSSRGIAMDFLALGGKATLKHGARGAQKAIQKQGNALYDLANREAILFARTAVFFKLKQLEGSGESRQIYRKEIAALRQYIKNTSGKGREEYPPAIGYMYVEDAKVKAELKLKEDAMLLKKYR